MINDEALIGYLDRQVDLERTREIEAALAASPELRRRLAELEAGDRGVREAFEALLEAPVPDALAERVRASIAAHEADGHEVVRLTTRPSLRLAERRGEIPRGGGWRTGLGWAVAAQFAAIVVLAGIIVQPKHESAAYHALGAAPASQAANLMVAFKPDTPERSLREALRGADVRIVGGPTAADVYLLHAPATQRDAALASLRSRREVTLAQPIDTPEPAR